MATVSVIIVSWNVRDLLRDCLQTLRQNPVPAEVIVVDNESADQSAEMVEAEFPEVRVIRSGGNLGFAAGMNLGARVATGDYLLLLNPDTVLRPGALATLTHLMDVDPSAALVAPLLIDPDGTRQASRRRFPSLVTLAVESTPYQALPLLRDVEARFRCTDTSAAHVQEIDYPFGPCLLVRRVALNEVGCMDTAYFMYSEEPDLCLRLHQLGWHILYEPAAAVVHHKEKSSEQQPLARIVRFNRAKVLYASKYYGRPAGEVLRVHLLGAFAYKYCEEAAKLLLGHKPELRRSRMATYRLAIDNGLKRLP